jgi:two-component system chemotaxis response regulator CheY
MGLRFLIVDDSATTRAIIRRTIRLSGVPADAVLEASNGIEALQMLTGERVDLVLADLHMPGMDGVELMKNMQRDQLLATIPVVIVSADPNISRIKELTRNGVRGHLRKPFTPESLRALIEQTLGAAHA